MFPDIAEEEKVINERHLACIRGLLYGNTGRQKNLFFYAYKFKIIPIELISSIYEEFYHKEAETKSKSKKKGPKANPQGAFYTPPALVEFLLSQVLTSEHLSTNPHILDPACGSGIFLVESFRRIVRYRSFKQGRRLRFDELSKILRNQLAGIDIESEAIRIAAFSLYLALLHYLDPPSIREQIKMGNRLPNIVFDEEGNNPDNYNILLVDNAFNNERMESYPILKKNFSSCCAHIVVGNPPWGSPGKKKKDEEARKQNKTAISWCEQRKLPIGDGERSQSFIWRTLDALKPNGIAGLLVSTGVFLKHHTTSNDFRKKWLDCCSIDSVYNFAHTRKVFFEKAISPFAAVVFQKSKVSSKQHPIHYWSSKRTRTIETLHSVVFTRNDLKLLRIDDDLSNYKTWKIYWWGNHQDSRLIRYLSMNDSLDHFTSLVGQGFKVANKKKDAGWLKKYKVLPDKRFKRYGKLNLDGLEQAPAKVESQGTKEIYDGTRLLVQRGIKEEGITPKGQIIARIEDKTFCFTNAIDGLRLSDPQRWRYHILLGILWSSVARYYFFLTSSNWGIWHHEIQLKDELLKLPVCFPEEKTLRNRIVKIVKRLQAYDPAVRTDNMFDTQGVPAEEIEVNRKKLETELDGEIFKLYRLSEAEIDVIRDMCETNLEYYYSPGKSSAGKPVLTKRLSKPYGTIESLPKDTVFSEYLEVFIRSWTPYLYDGTEFGWQVYHPEQTDSMIAVVFSVQNKSKNIDEHIIDDIACWNDVLVKLENDLTQPFHSSRIYIEGTAWAVTDDFIVIIKRNERRLWTKSTAREDVETTVVKAMNRKSMMGKILQKQ
jgi:type I restriction-modification system DNA methylase subunit